MKISKNQLEQVFSQLYHQSHVHGDEQFRKQNLGKINFSIGVYIDSHVRAKVWIQICNQVLLDIG